MSKRIHVRIAVEATDAADNSPFWDGGQKWYSLPYAQFVEVQALLHELDGKLLDWAREDAASRSEQKVAGK